MSWPGFSFQPFAQSVDADVGGKALRINFGGFRKEQCVYSRGRKLFAVRFQRARIFCEVFLGPELFWIYKNRSDDRRTLLARARDERGVTFVQSAHGRNQANDAAVR